MQKDCGQWASGKDPMADVFVDRCIALWMTKARASGSVRSSTREARDGWDVRIVYGMFSHGTARSDEWQNDQ